MYDESDGFVELTCLKATAEDAGRYKVMGRNSVGKMTVEAQAIVGGTISRKPKGEVVKWGCSNQERAKCAKITNQSTPF